MFLENRIAIDDDRVMVCPDCHLLITKEIVSHTVDECHRILAYLNAYRLEQLLAGSKTGKVSE
jgi:hypothetical protein